MPKPRVARTYVIEYVVPSDSEIRRKEGRYRFPERMLNKFKELNPKATVLRMYDFFSKESVNIDD